MRRFIGVAVVLSVVLGGVALAGDGEARKRAPANRAHPQARPGVEASRAEARAALRTALQNAELQVTWSGACQTLRCINRRLNVLKTAANNLRADLKALDNCLFIQGMSSFGEDPNGGTFGYVWRDDTIPDEFLTTGLDFDDSGTPHVWTVVWGC